MNHSMKAAFIAFGIISTLTGVKFFLYWLSGSLAVLSEAWHSFADITTTFLVLISIWRQEQKQKHRAIENESSQIHSGQETGKKGSKSIKRYYHYIRSINTEIKAAVIIGLLLLCASLTILWNSFHSEPVEVSSPLLTGIIFIFLSFGSFFLFRFENSIGRSENSAALTADGHHNRADMVISLLTGFSLVIYHFGIDVDRWAGLFIALYILSFALELLVNNLRAVLLQLEEVELVYTCTSIIGFLFTPSFYRKIVQRIEHVIKPQKRVKSILCSTGKAMRFISVWAVKLSLAALLLYYAGTTLFMVNPNEEALLFRLGKLVNKEQVYGPGLHMKLPFPFDVAVKYPTQDIQAITVGNSVNGAANMIWTREHGDTMTFISGDNNLFLPFMVLHYRISDIHDFHMSFKINTVDKVLVSTASRLLNLTFSQMNFYDLILHERKGWTEQFQNRLQEELDHLRCGITILDFCLIDMHPPVELASAYEDVVAAGQLKETYLNDAHRKVNSLLSRVRVEARKTKTEAETYVTEKIKMAEGEASNYLLRFSGFEEGGETMKNLLLLKSAEKTLKGKKLYLIDPNSGIDEKLLYIENFITGK